MKRQRDRRSLKDLTISPTLSISNEKFKAHLDAVMELEGTELMWGGKPVTGHQIPAPYGCYEPTAVKVPLKHFRAAKKMKLLTTELFAPFQIIVEYNGEKGLETILDICEGMSHHLTAATVSNDPRFINYVNERTVNGTSYTGWRARTTGAPQNHWFGPAGDPRGAGIGTKEAI
jgi:1-pyrroline-5-carboxylate dehydrogenase